ncbi:FMN-binding protein [Serpentinicella sp. ANB-PHB4]|uniref:FMN-binding protein n=1 Tax=Serpentinicella sp. ANB-PHB4 TaxID=3074076 RepID=UPI0028671951|nr:FMN-binding protein [Serpentinicella sp. ANB-PHB4]MDR5659686.1 FMN-binding protein [Serpentinicella sp. ANB-PHB4]
MKKNKLFLLLLVAFLVIFSAVGCRPEETPPPDGTETPPADDPITDPVGDGQYEDGTYTAQGEPTDRGWQAEIEIVVEGGQITEVNYEELNEEGDPKSEDEEYNDRWRDVAETDATEAFPGYEQALIESQNVEDVDVITGATTTHETFTRLASEALDMDMMDPGMDDDMDDDDDAAADMDDDMDDAGGMDNNDN